LRFHGCQYPMSRPTLAMILEGWEWCSLKLHH
jgi:hypothetical protein